MRDRTVGETFYMFFTTRAFATGIPTVLAGTPVVSAYEDNSATQITAGITLGVSHDSVVGLNLLTLVATGANGYEAGKDYSMVITTGTVGGVSVVGEVVGEFSLGLSSAFTRLGAPAGASVSADVADVPTVAELNARTLVAASYFDPAADAVANVTLVATATDVTNDVGITAAAVDLVWDEVLTGGTHNVNNSSGRRLRQLQEAGGYGGFVWIDTADGTAGTTSFENGTDTLPVLTLADGLTIAGNVNLKNFMATRDSVLAPVADFNNFTVYGTGYAFTLGGFDYAGTHIFHASPLSGIATSNNNSDHFDVLDSIVGAITVDDAHFTNCALTGDITLGGVGTATPGQLRLVNCFSLVADDGDVAIDFGTGSENHDVNVVNWQGNLQLTNFNVVTTGGTDTINITGMGKLLIDSSCDGGTIYLRGHWDIQDNSGGAVTITQDDPATSIIAIEVDTAAGGAGPWTTGAGGTPPSLMQNTTIATLASQTSFTLTAGSADNDAYNDAMAIITDASTSTQKAQARILDYVGSTKTITLLVDPAIFTMATGDTIDIIANLSSADAQYWNGVAITTALETAADVADAVLDEDMTAHQTTGSLGAAIGDGDAGAGMTAINLPNQTMDITGNLSGSIGSNLELGPSEVNAECDTAIADAALATAANLATVDGNVDLILVDTDATIPALIAALNDLSAAAVNAECDTAIADAALATAANLATVDTVVDAIKVITDQMVFTKANELDANTLSINSAAVVGDGNATPWDGA